MRMTLAELAQEIPNLATWNHVERIKLFAWYLHAQKKQEHFQAPDLRRCYEELHLDPPSSISPFLASMERKKPKEVLKRAGGFRLEMRVREALDKKFGTRQITVQVTELLASLPAAVPDLAERTFLDEALVCFKHGASRAAIVMAWNLAYHHLCDHVLRKELTRFNHQWPLVYQGHHRKGAKTIARMEDFADELKESEVLEVCNSAGIISKDIHKILKAKLDRRNSAAHPSSVKIDQLQAEEFIDDIVKNVVLKL
jgi:hypothetical protein